MGKFIALEGIDGCGKTTTVPLVVDKLNEMGCRAAILNKKNYLYKNKLVEQYAKNIHDLIWYEEEDPHKFVTDQGWLYFHALWYTILIENELEPSLKENDIVIVDGWFYKIYSKFLLKEKFDISFLRSIQKSLKECDNVYMLDVRPEVCWKRKKYKLIEVGGYDNENITDDNRYESYISYQNKVRNCLLSVIADERWVSIDVGNQNSDHIANIISNDIIKNFYGV